MGNYPVRRLAALLVALSVLPASCGTRSVVTQQVQQLRVANVGSVPIARLTVLFPDEQVAIGDVPPGVTTRYVDAPGGVYRYAAYRLEIRGELVTQPVIDWVGERPMEGRAFTYSLEVDPDRPRFEIVNLVGVRRDD